ncbi:alcohol dehydrogenase catalytic domain-containing protein [Nocardia sp. NPDC052112]|uniref:alcohol dehydrogenase catalytic domain-containing protein n=1 Tax=Nocardia sp. NPDC052112 TaxID=3155646 RepID=UPI00341ADC25
MTAARYHADTRTFALEQVAIPEPGQGEVLVRVEACGICMSDVHLVEGLLPPPIPDVTPGHEAAGTIAAIGAAVPDRWKEGARVALTPGRACGRCANCVRGRSADECVDVQVMGAHYDGAWAQYVVVGYEQLVAVPDNIPLEQAAILADAVTTPYSALVDTATLRAGQSIGIWGLGGLGTHAVQIARLAGAAPIIALDPSEPARDRALRLGADVVLDPSDPGHLDEIRTLTKGSGLDAAVEFVGYNAVRAQAAAALGQAGKAVLVGLTPEPITLPDPITIQLRMQEIRGHLGGGLRHLEQLVSLVELGRLDVSSSVTATMPLTEIDKGIAQLNSREGNPVRLVVLPQV